jgi:hypothetical protein
MDCIGRRKFASVATFVALPLAVALAMLGRIDVGSLLGTLRSHWSVCVLPVPHS